MNSSIVISGPTGLSTQGPVGVGEEGARLSMEAATIAATWVGSTRCIKG